MFIKTCFTAFVLLLSCNSFAQLLEVDEKTPAVENGFEYGYIIKNEQLKSAGGEEYSRYELTFYITNKSGVPRSIKIKRPSSLMNRPTSWQHSIAGMPMEKGLLQKAAR